MRPVMNPLNSSNNNGNNTTNKQQQEQQQQLQHPSSQEAQRCSGIQLNIRQTIEGRR